MSCSLPQGKAELSLHQHARGWVTLAHGSWVTLAHRGFVSLAHRSVRRGWVLSPAKAGLQGAGPYLSPLQVLMLAAEPGCPRTLPW